MPKHRMVISNRWSVLCQIPERCVDVYKKKTTCKYESAGIILGVGITFKCKVFCVCGLCVCVCVLLLLLLLLLLF